MRVKNWLTQKQWLYKLAGTIIVLLIITFSGSRSGFIAFGIEAVFMLMIRQFKLSLTKSFLIAFCLFLISLSLPFFQRDTIYENRAEIWQTAVYAGYEHPIIGWGFGNAEKAFTVYDQKLYNRLRGYYIDSSHNIFLDWWVQGGFLGLTALVCLVYFTIRVFLHEGNVFFLCAFLGVLTVLSFNPVSVVILLQFWFLIGAALGDYEETTQRSQKQPSH